MHTDQKAQIVMIQETVTANQMLLARNVTTVQWDLLDYPGLLDV